jgi:hypothetical protein
MKNIIFIITFILLTGTLFVGIFMYSKYQNTNPSPSSVSVLNNDFRGIYVVSNFSKSNNEQKSSFDERVYSLPYIDGIVIEGLWSSIEPSPNNYDWTLVDAQIVKAISNNKKITLAITAGAYTPAWLYQPPYEVVHDTFYWSSHGGNTGKECVPYVLPAPWDLQFEEAYTNMMKALSEHLKTIDGAYESVTRIKLTGINTLTNELHLGFCKNTDGLLRWQKLGYTPDKILASGKILMNAVNNAFPDKVLALNIIESGGLPLISNKGEIIEKTNPDYVDAKQSLIEYGLASVFKNRFSVQWNGFNSEDTSGRESILNAKKEGAIIGWQTNNYGGPLSGAQCYGKTTESSPCAEDDYQKILDAMIDSGGNYLEIFSVNAVQFPKAITEAGLRLKNASF